jgi:hypothetical protein
MDPGAGLLGLFLPRFTNKYLYHFMYLTPFKSYYSFHDNEKHKNI